MTHIESARVNEVIGLQIGTIQEAAHKLDAGSEIQELEAGISGLERTIADLKTSLAALPHRRS